MKTLTWIGWLTGTAALAGLALAALSQEAAERPVEKVSLRRMADALHAALTAAQTVYLDRCATNQNPRPAGPDTKNWRMQDTLPNHAQFLRLTSEQIATGGAEFSFALRSPWPMNPRHAAQTQAEETALARLRSRPTQPMYVDEQLGGRAYFTAIYPQRASRSACIQCHNANPASPRRDYQLNEFMGALVIRIPKEF